MAIVFYFLLSIYLGKKNPLFYLLLPVALQQGPGAFIDQSFSIGGKKPFSVYDSLFSDVLFFITVSIAVFLIKAQFPKLKNTGSTLIIFYLMYLLLLFGVDFFTYGNSSEVLLTARNFFYIPFAYILWSSIYQSITRKQYESFLNVLFFITPISGILYILNSSAIFSIFPKELIYLEVDMSPSNSFRDFATMPFFLVPILVLSIQSLLMPIFKIPKYIILINLFVLPVALTFTFTRSLIIGVAMQLLIMVVLNAFNNGAKGIKQGIVFVLLFVVALGPVYLLANKAFPSQLEYLTNRFTSVSKDGAKEENVDVRVAYLEKAVQITKYTSSVFGAGMNRKYYPELNNVGAWTADSTIPYLLYHTGWFGVAVLYSILLIFIFDSVLHFFKTGDWLIAYLASNFITLTVSSLIMGGLELNGSVWTFMNLALYTTVKFNLWRKSILYFRVVPNNATLQMP